eukprot:SAG11_NODE_295_length_11115_cov_14.005264_2_plen_163_part_00
MEDFCPPHSFHSKCEKSFSLKMFPFFKHRPAMISAHPTSPRPCRQGRSCNKFMEAAAKVCNSLYGTWSRLQRSATACTVQVASNQAFVGLSTRPLFFVDLVGIVQGRFFLLVFRRGLLKIRRPCQHVFSRISVPAPLYKKKYLKRNCALSYLKIQAHIRSIF